jgi:hypothetical protein
MIAFLLKLTVRSNMKLKGYQGKHDCEDQTLTLAKMIACNQYFEVELHELYSLLV